MNEPENGGPGLILPFTAINRGALAVAGGKAANLGELTLAGFPVPAGFCVTTAAYDLVAADAGLGPTLASLDGTQPEDTARLAELATEARACLSDASVPDSLGLAIAGAYEELGDGAPVPVAVRSSATAEDLPQASFAGQQDTYLNVVGVESVLDAVRRCWASLWTDRAVSYRATNGIDPRTRAPRRRRAADGRRRGRRRPVHREPGHREAPAGRHRRQPGPRRGRRLGDGQP